MYVRSKVAVDGRVYCVCNKFLLFHTYFIAHGGIRYNANSFLSRFLTYCLLRPTQSPTLSRTESDYLLGVGYGVMAYLLGVGYGVMVYLLGVGYGVMAAQRSGLLHAAP